MNGLQAAEASDGWFRLDTVFWLTVALVFLLTVANVLIRRRKRDAALRLMDDSPVTVILASNQAITGRVTVTSQGIEIHLARPEASRAGVLKSSMLLYEPELATMTAIVRTPQNLNEVARQERRAELDRQIEPGPIHALGRAIYNLFNSARDALVQAMSLFMGRLRPGGTVAAALRGQEQGVVGVGQSVMGLVGNAYEPLLERHVGDTVIVQIAALEKADPPPPLREFAGYLVAYTDKYLCIMANGAGEPRRAQLVSPPTASGSVDGEGLRIERHATTAHLVATGPQAVVLSRVTIANRAVEGTPPVLLEGARCEVIVNGDGALEVSYELTRAVDLVVPRSRTQVRFGAMRSASLDS